MTARRECKAGGVNKEQHVLSLTQRRSLREIALPKFTAPRISSKSAFTFRFEDLIGIAFLFIFAFATPVQCA